MTFLAHHFLYSPYFLPFSLIIIFFFNTQVSIYVNVGFCLHHGDLVFYTKCGLHIRAIWSGEWLNTIYVFKNHCDLFATHGFIE